MEIDDAARRWIAEVTGARVVSSRRPSGGVSSLIDLVVLEDSDGTRREVVLRRIPYDPTWHPDPTGEAHREAEMLERRAGCPFTPVLLATDLDGARSALPAVLATRLPGEPLVAPDDVDAWVAGLAEAVCSVRRCETETNGLAGFERWDTVAGDAPDWSAVAEAWRVLGERIDAGRFRGTAVGLVHRDLHPGNVLFEHGAFSGLVDWGDATIGPIEVDVSRCRVEVALLAGLDAAGQFLEACGGFVPDYDRTWDAFVARELGGTLEDLLVFNDLGATLTVDGMRATLDALVAAAV